MERGPLEAGAGAVGTTEPVRAEAGWLRLREPADAAARARDLVAEVAPLLQTAGVVVHDLGSGTGSMARWLAPRLAGPQHWVLHDRDDELLAGAAADPPAAASDGARVTAEPRTGDITRLDPDVLAGAHLVTASALLDMMTAAELGRLVGLCAVAGCPVLVTLSVVGRVDLVPAEPLDAQVQVAFNDHQRRATAAGRLLGPDAYRTAADLFRESGLRVLERPSPWRLGPEHRALMAEWFAEWVDAAVEQEPGLEEDAETYRRRRLAQLAAGQLSAVVHHLDLLALPARGGRRGGRPRQDSNL